ncbi:unnamed protein product, partial [Tenebrio molitor]
THNHSDFSIEHILNKAGSSTSSTSANFTDTSHTSATNSTITLDPYSWLQCTRYCPPKLPSGVLLCVGTQKRDGPQKRQLGRHPRIPFTSRQLSILEEKFRQSQYLSSEEVITLSRQLQLADVRVKIWFQNRRARERREKLLQTTSHEASHESKKETNSSAHSASLRTSPVGNSGNQHLFSFFPPHGALENHLVNYLVPLSNQIQYVNKDDR